MREWIAYLAACLPIFCGSVSAQGKHPAEDVVVKMLGQLENMADLLSSMKDEASAGAAREELKKHIESYRELRGRAEKMPPPPREVKDRLAKEYRKKFVAAQERLMGEIARVRTAVPGGREAIAEVRNLLLGKEFRSKTPPDKDGEEKE